MSVARSSVSPPPSKRRRRPSDGTHSNGSPRHSSALPPLSLSILGVEPIDEFIKEVADFVHYMISTRPKSEPNVKSRVELEAKIGMLKDKSTGQRLRLPVLVESILDPGVECRFESNMSSMQHKHFNTLLNDLQTTSSQPSSPSSPITYSHKRLIDSFYAEGHDKIRVTRDERTGAVVDCMKKVRLGDLNVYSPKSSADWRVSVNMEIDVPYPTGTATYTRRKDRMSYAHEEFIVDLTQVTSTTSPNSAPEILHELELEIARPALLLSTAALRGDPSASEHERSAFDELIRAFVNNARILVRNAGSGDNWP